MKDSVVKKEAQYNKIAEMNYEIHINWSYVVHCHFLWLCMSLTFTRQIIKLYEENKK